MGDGSEKCGLGVSPVLSFFYSGGTPVGEASPTGDIKTPQVEHLFKTDGRWEMGGNFVTKTKINASNQQRLSDSKLSIHQFDRIVTILTKKLASQSGNQLLILCGISSPSRSTVNCQLSTVNCQLIT